MREKLDPVGAASSEAEVGQEQRGGTLTREAFPVFKTVRTIGWGVLLTLCLLLLFGQTFTVSRGPTDFCQDYIAAGRLLAGQSIYLPLHCWQGIVPVPAPLEYNSHPPFAALLFLPFGLFPLVTATTLWGLCCLAAYLASGFLLLQALGWRLLRGMAVFALCSLFWEPYTLAVNVLNFGQLLTFLLIAAWRHEQARHERWAGVLLGLAALLKVWPALLLLVPLLRRRWGQMVAGGATLVVGTVLTLMVLGLGAYTAYLGPVQANEAYYVPNGGNLSLVAAIARPLAGYRAPSVLLPALVQGVSLTKAITLGEGAAGILLLGTLGVITWSLWRTQVEAVVLLSQSLLISVLLLVFPLTWHWGLLTFLLPGALLILALRQLPKPPRWWRVLLWVSLVLLVEPGWLLVLPGWLITRETAGLAGLGTILFGLPTYGLLLFTGMLIYLLWHATTEASKQPGGTSTSRTLPFLTENEPESLHATDEG